jgi:hypothetical protein
MNVENYPTPAVRVLTPPEIVARWRELGWGDAAASFRPDLPYFREMKNEYGVPLHACAGVCCDAHYWAWVATWCGDGSGRRPDLSANSHADVGQGLRPGPS